MRTPDPAEALIGELVDDRYRIRRMIGRGGMGAVFEADAVRLGRLCAVKVLLPEYTRDDTTVQRFRREALVASRVKHPHVVDIFDTGSTSSGLGYIAMELLHGESLGQTIRREGRLPWPRVRHIAMQMCRALSAAHARGVIHRDMKPDNCFRLTHDGDPDFIKILDFGIAKLLEGDGKDLRLTASDSLIGTYSYMAYEQIKGLEPDHRVDIWAVGVILYVMLTGRLPFRGENERQVFSAILMHEPAPLRDLIPSADLPPELDAVVARALEKSRDSRYPTIDALARALAGVGQSSATALEALPLGTPSTTLKSLVDDAARTLPRNAPAKPPARAVAAVVDIPEDTAESGRKDLGPSTEPHSGAEVARAAASLATASVPVLGPDKTAVQSKGAWIAPLIASAVLLTLALLALALAQTGDGAPTESSPSPATNPDAPPEPVPRPAAPTMQAPPETPKFVEPPVPAEPPPAAPSTKAGTSAQRGNKPAKRPAVDYKARASAELTKLCQSKPIRDCFVDKQKQDLEMNVSFRLDPVTGDVQPIFPTLQRNSGLAVCLESKMKSWRLPKPGASEPPPALSCTLNRQG